MSPSSPSPLTGEGWGGGETVACAFPSRPDPPPQWGEGTLAMQRSISTFDRRPKSRKTSEVGEPPHNPGLEEVLADQYPAGALQAGARNPEGDEGGRGAANTAARQRAAHLPFDRPGHPDAGPRGPGRGGRLRRPGSPGPRLPAAHHADHEPPAPRPGHPGGHPLPAPHRWPPRAHPRAPHPAHRRRPRLAEATEDVWRPGWLWSALPTGRSGTLLPGSQTKGRPRHGPSATEPRSATGLLYSAVSRRSVGVVKEGIS